LKIESSGIGGSLGASPQSQYWSNGILEWWVYRNSIFASQYSSTPSLHHSMLRVLDRLKILVPTSRAAEIADFPIDHTLDTIFLGKVGLTERVFEHHVINHCQSLLLWSALGGLLRKRPLFEYPIAKINKKAKD
jgi:hypothetical protein